MKSDVGTWLALLVVFVMFGLLIAMSLLDIFTQWYALEICLLVVIPLIALTVTYFEKRSERKKAERAEKRHKRDT